MIYVSEKGVPMWKVGYELCDDQVREAFRVAAGSLACNDNNKNDIDTDLPWPSLEARSKWLRGLALCRHICDCALQHSLSFIRQESSLNANMITASNNTLRPRPLSGGWTWKKESSEQGASSHRMLCDRPGDFSVLYAMHYFNQTNEDDNKLDGPIVSDEVVDRDDNEIEVPRINVKQHVDPSLFVLEPYLADEPGLQVFTQGHWITCDGPKSPIHSALSKGNSNNMAAMVLFVGKALAAHVDGVEPTLHRVIATQQRRTTMIYEQKYEEFFPPPIMD